MILFDQIKTNVKNRVFSSILSNNLIYNSCWEDPRIDRELLQLDRNSRVVMLTSAGCNALDYLLDNPANIYCIDQNHRQNALLNLKKSLFMSGDFSLLETFFAEGRCKNAGKIYRTLLRKFLDNETARYWDSKITYFSDDNFGDSFYFNGTSGKLAWMVHKYLSKKNMLDIAEKLLNSHTLKEQQYYYRMIDEQLWSNIVGWVINRDATMYLLGVPATQRSMIVEEYQEGLKTFVREAIQHVFTNLRISDNYFWRVYITGRYSKSCRPNYLKPEHFTSLAARVDQLSTHTCLITDFLKRNPAKYSHYILLDHQDWLVEHNASLLAEEWELILNNSHPGTKILFRSAAKTHSFLPKFVFNRVHFLPEITKPLHQRDRVGTYGSTHLAVVQ